MLEVAGLLSGEYRGKFADTQLLATFMECHDMPRWPRIVSEDGAAMENAVAWTVLTDGIPLVYVSSPRNVCWMLYLMVAKLEISPTFIYMG